jgi:hypothetical protein
LREISRKVETGEIVLSEEDIKEGQKSLGELNQALYSDM